MTVAGKIFGHLRNVLVHKYFVCRYCFKFGLYWRGIVHDMSKFSPAEFSESVKYYTGDRSPIEVCKEKTGVSRSWLHHRGRNTHHYEYWCDNFDSGTTTIPMPWEDATEMICDYLAAGRTYAGPKFTVLDELAWWRKKKQQCKMDPKTKKYVTDMLLFMVKKRPGSLRAWSKYIYEQSNKHDKNE